MDDVRGRAERYVCDHAGEKKRFQNGVWTASFESIAQIQTGDMRY